EWRASGETSALGRDLRKPAPLRSTGCEPPHADTRRRTILPFPRGASVRARPSRRARRQGGLSVPLLPTWHFLNQSSCTSSSQTALPSGRSASQRDTEPWSANVNHDGECRRLGAECTRIVRPLVLANAGP